MKDNLTDIGLSKTYSISEKIVHQEVNDEVVLLSMDTGKYYGLNCVATRLWHLLVDSGNYEDAVCVLLDEYDVSEAELRADVSEILRNLVTDGLLTISDGQVN